jgi:hypothetical protein
VFSHARLPWCFGPWRWLNYGIYLFRRDKWLVLFGNQPAKDKNIGFQIFEKESSWPTMYSFQFNIADQSTQRAIAATHKYFSQSCCFAKSKTSP